MLRAGIRLSIFGAALLISVVNAQDSPKKLSKGEAARAAVGKVEPEYPAVARQLKLQGTVELEAVITEEGTVGDVRILSGNPVLTKAAAQAVKHWKFTPVMEGGKPVKAIAPLELSFKL